VDEQIEGEGGLSHAGAGGDKGYFPDADSPGEKLVEVGPRGLDYFSVAPGCALLHVVEESHHQFLGGEVAIVGGEAVGDGGESLCGGGNLGFHLIGLGTPEASKALGERGNGGSLEVLGFDDAKVVVEVSAGGGKGEYVGDLGGAADVFEEVAVGKGLGEGDEFDGLPGLADADEVAAKGGVGRQVEPFRGESLIRGAVDVSSRRGWTARGRWRWGVVGVRSSESLGV
jgi:hypothetical protein